MNSIGIDKLPLRLPECPKTYSIARKLAGTRQNRLEFSQYIGLIDKDYYPFTYAHLPYGSK